MPSRPIRRRQRTGELDHPQLGRPGVPIRLMVGLCYLQHTFQLSDQEVVERWVENPYWQGSAASATCS